MRWTYIALALLGIAIAGLGVLWLLQGSDLVHIDPILCLANCVPITGHQPQWQIAGGIAMLVGLVILVLVSRRASAGGGHPQSREHEKAVAGRGRRGHTG